LLGTRSTKDCTSNRISKLLLGLLVLFMLNLNVDSQAEQRSSTREEVRLLERAIEEEVQGLLAGVLVPSEYAVYVSVKIEANDEVLDAYYREVALSHLPGLPMSDPNASLPARNRLFSLVDHKKVMVVLDQSVSAEKELLVRDVLSGKLALQEASGDALEIRRSELGQNFRNRQIADISPTLKEAPNWMRYALIALAVALVAAFIILLWQLSLLRERVNSRAKLSADLTLDQFNKNEEATGVSAEDEENGEGETAAPPVLAADEELKRPDIPSVFELKEKFIALAIAHPKAASHVARKMMNTEEGLFKLAVTSQTIGFEFMKKLFDSISSSKWKTLGSYLRENLVKITHAPAGEAILEVYTELLVESMGWDSDDGTEDPFDFLHKLSESQIRKILMGEDPAQIAFIAAFWEPEELSSILNVLSDGQKKKTLLHVARLKAFPQEVVETAALRFAERLKSIQAEKEVDVDGNQVIAKLLGSIDGELEEEVLAYIGSEDPEVREELRKVYFTFDSLALVPVDILEAVFEKNLETEVLIKALYQAPHDVVDAVLGVLPSKQRSIVVDDLAVAEQRGGVPKNQVYLERKRLLVMVQAELSERGLTFDKVMELSQQNEAA
jgi:flagellar motor switch protein FliG